MKNKPNNLRNQGSALVITLAYVTVISLLISGLLLVTSQQYLLSKRTAAWEQALESAEAGIEVGWNEANKLTTVNTNGVFMSGWTSLGGNSWSLANQTLSPLGGADSPSTYSVTVVTNSPTAGEILMTSTGWMNSAVMTSQSRRVVQVALKPISMHSYGILTKGLVSLTGNAYVDSFDSSNPNKSTNGLYDPSKSQNNGNVGTDSSAVPAISGTGNAVIYGTVDTGPGGTVTCTTSPASSNNADMKQSIPDVGLPSGLGGTGSGTINITGNGAQVINTLNGLQYNYSSISVSGNGALTITGSGLVQIYDQGNFSISGNGQMILTPNPSTALLQVALYTQGSVSISGNGVNNQTGRAANFAIKGLPNCTSISYTGNADFIGTMYAPEANVSITGNGSNSGSVVANTMTLTGNGGFHFDESLGTSSQVTGYSLVTWEEK